jgi:hypothetical protein
MLTWETTEMPCRTHAPEDHESSLDKSPCMTLLQGTRDAHRFLQ